jgi:carboxyl-terminal processing protease
MSTHSHPFKQPRHISWAFLSSFGALCLASCGEPPLLLSDVPGIWKSDGYGWYITIKDGKAGEVYHAIDGLCLQIKDDEIGGTIAGLSPISLEKNGDAFTASTSENITHFRFRKADALPQECSKTGALNPDPIANFEAAWKYFDADYVFFAEHKVDWKAVYRRYRPQVTSQTTSEELYSILSNMLAELNDRHVIIDHTDGREFRAGLGPVVAPWFKDFTVDPQGTENAIDYVNMRMAPFKAIVDQRYMTGPVSTAGQGQIAWGRLKGDVGYIRLDAFSYFDAREGYKYQKAELEAAMAKALQELKDVKAFVIDMRFNLGGNDGLGLTLMSHFADKERLAYTKQARMGAGFTALQNIKAVPAKERFNGKVAVLIGNVTVSGGENFTIATLPYPHIFRVGETTAGALSDVLMKPLPNGWLVGISNEIFRAADGHDVETLGIKPDIAVPGHFSPQTLLTKRDMVLETALSKLIP